MSTLNIKTIPNIIVMKIPFLRLSQNKKQNGTIVESTVVLKEPHPLLGEYFHVDKPYLLDETGEAVLRIMSPERPSLFCNFDQFMTVYVFDVINEEKLTDMLTPPI